MNYAGFWIRVAATIIDTIVFAIFLTPLTIFVYGIEYYTAPEASFFQGPADVVISWILPLVATVIFWVTLAATPGKLVLGLKVVDASAGEKIGVIKAFLRYLGYFVSAIPVLIGYIWVAFDARKQGWHDKIAGTVVVHAK